jgi:hypothetical protein
MITKRTAVGRIELLEDGVIQLREDIVIEEDGVELHRAFHRRVLEPSLTAPVEADARIVSIAAILWTPEVVQRYRDRPRGPRTR